MEIPLPSVVLDAVDLAGKPLGLLGSACPVGGDFSAGRIPRRYLLNLLDDKPLDFRRSSNSRFLA